MSIGYPDFFSYSLTEKFDIWSASGSESGWLNLGDTEDLANETGKYVIDNIIFYIQSDGEYFQVTVKTYVDGVLVNSKTLREHVQYDLDFSGGLFWECFFADPISGKRQYRNKKQILFNTSFQMTISLTLWDSTQLFYGCGYDLYSASPEVIFYPK